jgi:hypothetical protein
MPLSKNETIEKLKLATMRRCEERMANAGKGSGFRVDGGQTPRSGVTAILKRRHGL